MLNRIIFADADSLLLGLSNSLTDLITSTLQRTNTFHLALTGGKLGNELAHALAVRINENPDRYQGLHVWWSDERFVPAGSEESNALAFLSAINSGVEIHIHRPISSDSNIDVDTSARRYAIDIYGIEMDLTLLSVGTDGHVASLFPLFWDPEATSSVIAIQNAPKAPPERISFSMAKINMSARVWILASGAAKAPIVGRLENSDFTFPVSHIQGQLETRLYTDF